MILLGDRGFVLMLNSKDKKNLFLLETHIEVLPREFARICLKTISKRVGVGLEESRISERQWLLELGDGHKEFTALCSLHSYVFENILKSLIIIITATTMQYRMCMLTFPEHLCMKTALHAPLVLPLLRNRLNPHPKFGLDV